MTAELDLFSAPFREAGKMDLRADLNDWHLHTGIEPKYCNVERNLKGVSYLIINGDASRIKTLSKELPGLTKVLYLVIGSRINQTFFDSVCSLKQLRRLSIVWSSINNLCEVSKLLGLTHFNLGSSPQLKSFSPISSLSKLNALGIGGNFKNIQNLEPIGSLKNLKGLELTGLESHIQCYDSLDPLSYLKELRYVGFAGIKIKYGGLAPLKYLTNLEHIFIPDPILKSWPKRDYQVLYENLPNLKTAIIKLAATDAEFQKKYRIK